MTASKALDPSIVRLADGRYRLYAFNQSQPSGQTVASFISTDGLSWTQEPGTRLTAPMGKQLTDPFVVHLSDGSWKMIFKLSEDQPPGGQP